MKIVVVYNQVSPDQETKNADHAADDDNLVMAKAVANQLGLNGHQVSLFSLDETNSSQLSALDTDLFFNLLEGVGNIPHSADQATEYIERTGKPFTGSSSTVIQLTTDKFLTKKMLTQAKIPCPRGILISGGQKISLSGLRYPVIVKPDCEDSSLGIDQTSVFPSQAGIESKVRQLQKHYSPKVMIEEFIDGPELRASILGDKVLPISELVYQPNFKNRYKIFDFDAKWNPSSEGYKHTKAVAPADLPQPLTNRVATLSLEAYRVTNCSDYARIDLRLDNQFNPYILEVNANPAIGPGDASVTSARAAKINYAQFLELIIASALKRYSQ